MLTNSLLTSPSILVPCADCSSPMATEEHEMSTGWPLGLEIMSTRLRVTESLQSQAVRAPAPAPAEEPYSIHVRAISFSSFSSSNLDTESTASFFQDNSVSLGRLIGFKAGNRRSLYFPNAIRFEEHERIRRTSSDMSKGHGICIPLLKMSRSRIKTKTVIHDGHGMRPNDQCLS
ncbi:hypothetical protein KPL71_005756 [Citrus sinensis]|uniref:Uncharacterized protein n=2 Tax=Citrus sinensis TaxID=2711 RepID=A0ACB8NGX2_CITSI|nr:hypothetical protein KPL71_005756 [Citrus sinensis]